MEDGVLILVINVDNNMNIDVVMYSFVWRGFLVFLCFLEFYCLNYVKGGFSKEISVFNNGVEIRFLLFLDGVKS